MDWFLSVLWRVTEVVLALLAIAVIDIWRCGYSRSISWPNLIKIRVLRLLRDFKVRRVTKQFEKDVRQFAEVQSAFLLGRIRRCESTTYGREHGFSSIHSVDDFRRTQPVTDYSHFQKYVDRMADHGDKLAMLGEEDDVSAFCLSSGTTGKHKRIPVSSQCALGLQKHLLFGVFQWKLQTDITPPSLRRVMTVTGGVVPKFTNSGHRICSVSDVTLSKSSSTLQCLSTSPAISSDVRSELEGQYIHLLFGLRDKQIVALICVFINNFVSLMRRLKVYQKDLVNDVRRGRIKEDLTIPASVRVALNAQLNPMPERAAEIERALSWGMRGIIPRLWPEITRVSSIWSGNSFDIYYREARETIGPDLPIISFGYLASEGMIGINLEPKRAGQPRYTLVPDTNFYEFLPIHNDQICDLEDVDPKQLLLPAELKVGHEYEIFMTTSSGFYRYRVGDVVRLVGFYQQAPQLEILYRSSQSLNVNGEKLAEDVVFRALRSAAARWPAQLKEYTAAGSQFAPDRDGLLNPHYLIFFEAEGPQLTDEHLAMVDSTLIDMHEHYASYRKLGKISPMELHRVPTGTFARFKQHLLDTTSVSTTQFKMPRVIKSHDRVIWFLDSLKGGNKTASCPA